MSFFTKKRRIVLGAVMALALAGVAYAYWTAGGSGTGSATAAGSQSPLTAAQTSTLSPMYPGDSAQTISGNFNNPNTSPVYVGTVTASISSVSKAAGVTGTCDASDFTLSNAAMTVGTEVPAGSSKGSWSGATIQFNNKSTTNQDACKGATVNLSYAIS